MLEAFLISTGLVALAEIGDKTQLLALLLAARFRKPIPIVLGILCATLANHALAGAVGSWVTRLFDPEVLRWILAASFAAMAVWALVPDDPPDCKEQRTYVGVFATTLIAFFLIEMGDKTQVATVALAAKYVFIIPVVIGTTLGMMLANTPAVILGDRLAHRLPMKLLRAISAALFLGIGIYILVSH
ncbi:MAG TPA: TMEM165/GDT1 family protein [Steroidobacteraceae bacterium]